MFKLLPFLKRKFELAEISWNFFASSHGKGSVDGIGGSVKRMVWQKVISRACRVNNAAEFQAAVSESKVKIILINNLQSQFDDFIATEMENAPKVKFIMLITLY